MTEQAATANWMKQMADISLIVGSIMGAVFFTLLLLTGNTMAQAVRERIPELAVLKTIGFRDGAVLGLVLAESVLLVLIGGVLGLGLAAALGPAITTVSGGVISMPEVDAASWLIGLGLLVAIGLLVGVMPAMRAMRLNIVDALAGRRSGHDEEFCHVKQQRVQLGSASVSVYGCQVGQHNVVDVLKIK